MNRAYLVLIFPQSQGHLEGMLQLMEEERNFYKKECELLRNIKGKAAMMSPPTRERVRWPAADQPAHHSCPGLTRHLSLCLGIR